MSETAAAVLKDGTDVVVTEFEAVEDYSGDFLELRGAKQVALVARSEVAYILISPAAIVVET